MRGRNKRKQRRIEDQMDGREREGKRRGLEGGKSNYASRIKRELEEKCKEPLTKGEKVRWRRQASWNREERSNAQAKSNKDEEKD